MEDVKELGRCISYPPIQKVSILVLMEDVKEPAETNNTKQYVSLFQSLF